MHIDIWFIVFRIHVSKIFGLKVRSFWLRFYLRIYDMLRVSSTTCPIKQRILMKSAIMYIFSESKHVWDPIFCSVNDVTDFNVYTTITLSCHPNFTEKSHLLFYLLIDFKIFGG